MSWRGKDKWHDDSSFSGTPVFKTSTHRRRWSHRSRPHGRFGVREESAAKWVCNWDKTRGARNMKKYGVSSKKYYHHDSFLPSGKLFQKSQYYEKWSVGGRAALPTELSEVLRRYLAAFRWIKVCPVIAPRDFQMVPRNLRTSSAETPRVVCDVEFNRKSSVAAFFLISVKLRVRSETTFLRVSTRKSRGTSEKKQAQQKFRKILWVEASLHLSFRFFRSRLGVQNSKWKLPEFSKST